MSNKIDEASNQSQQNVDSVEYKLFELRPNSQGSWAPDRDVGSIGGYIAEKQAKEKLPQNCSHGMNDLVKGNASNLNLFLDLDEPKSDKSAKFAAPKLLAKPENNGQQVKGLEPVSQQVNLLNMVKEDVILVYDPNLPVVQPTINMPQREVDHNNYWRLEETKMRLIDKGSLERAYERAI